MQKASHNHAAKPEQIPDSHKGFKPFFLDIPKANEIGNIR